MGGTGAGVRRVWCRTGAGVLVDLWVWRIGGKDERDFDGGKVDLDDPAVDANNRLGST